MRLVIVLALLSFNAYAETYRLIGSQMVTNQYGAVVYVCTYNSASGLTTQIQMPPGQPCPQTINR